MPSRALERGSDAFVLLSVFSDYARGHSGLGSLHNEGAASASIQPTVLKLVDQALMIRSILRDAPIREQFDAVHVAAVIRREKHRYLGHLVCRSQTTERHLGNNPSLLLISHQSR